MAENRRLIAIMPACHCQGLSSAGRFTDIVGYTALMGADEDRAFEVLSKNREILYPNLVFSDYKNHIYADR
jgi:hypothetical protein